LFCWHLKGDLNVSNEDLYTVSINTFAGEILVGPMTLDEAIAYAGDKYPIRPLFRSSVPAKNLIECPNAERLLSLLGE